MATKRKRTRARRERRRRTRGKKPAGGKPQNIALNVSVPQPMSVPQMTHLYAPLGGGNLSGGAGAPFIPLSAEFANLAPLSQPPLGPAPDYHDEFRALREGLDALRARPAPAPPVNVIPPAHELDFSPLHAQFRGLNDNLQVFRMDLGNLAERQQEIFRELYGKMDREPKGTNIFNQHHHHHHPPAPAPTPYGDAPSADLGGFTTEGPMDIGGRGPRQPIYGPLHFTHLGKRRKEDDVLLLTDGTWDGGGAPPGAKKTRHDGPRGVVYQDVAEAKAADPDTVPVPRHIVLGVAEAKDDAEVFRPVAPPAEAIFQNTAEAKEEERRAVAIFQNVAEAKETSAPAPVKRERKPTRGKKEKIARLNELSALLKDHHGRVNSDTYNKAKIIVEADPVYNEVRGLVRKKAPIPDSLRNAFQGVQLAVTHEIGDV